MKNRKARYEFSRKVKMAMELADAIFNFNMNEEMVPDLAGSKLDISLSGAHDDLLQYIADNGGPAWNGDDQEWVW